VQRPEVGDNPCAERVEMEVADEFQKVRLFLDHDGLVAVLEEVPDPFVTAIESAGVSGQ
jgi:hypothetical protein